MQNKSKIIIYLGPPKPTSPVDHQCGISSEPLTKVNGTYQTPQLSVYYSLKFEKGFFHDPSTRQEIQKFLQFLKDQGQGQGKVTLPNTGPIPQQQSDFMLYSLMAKAITNDFYTQAYNLYTSDQKIRPGMYKLDTWTDLSNDVVATFVDKFTRQTNMYGLLFPKKSKDFGEFAGNLKRALHLPKPGIETDSPVPKASGKVVAYLDFVVPDHNLNTIQQYLSTGILKEDKFKINGNTRASCELFTSSLWQTNTNTQDVDVTLPTPTSPRVKIGSTARVYVKTWSPMLYYYFTQMGVKPSDLDKLKTKIEQDISQSGVKILQYVRDLNQNDYINALQNNCDTTVSDDDSHSHSFDDVFLTSEAEDCVCISSSGIAPVDYSVDDKERIQTNICFNKKCTSGDQKIRNRLKRIYKLNSCTDHCSTMYEWLTYSEPHDPKLVDNVAYKKACNADYKPDEGLAFNVRVLISGIAIIVLSVGVIASGNLSQRVKVLLSSIVFIILASLTVYLTQDLAGSSWTDETTYKNMCRSKFSHIKIPTEFCSTYEDSECLSNKNNCDANTNCYGGCLNTICQPGQGQARGKETLFQTRYFPVLLSVSALISGPLFGMIVANIISWYRPVSRGLRVSVILACLLVFLSAPLVVGLRGRPQAKRPDCENVKYDCQKGCTLGPMGTYDDEETCKKECVSKNFTLDTGNLGNSNVVFSLYGFQIKPVNGFLSNYLYNSLSNKTSLQPNFFTDEENRAIEIEGFAEVDSLTGYGPSTLIISKRTENPPPKVYVVFEQKGYVFNIFDKCGGNEQTSCIKHGDDFLTVWYYPGEMLGNYGNFSDVEIYAKEPSRSALHGVI